MTTPAAEPPEILRDAGMNPVYLPPGGPTRGLIAAEQPRSEQFLARFERNVLFYDVFWHADGKRIILHGPAPVDLGSFYAAMRFVAQPSGVLLRASGHHSSLVQLYAMVAPAGTTHLDIVFGGHVSTVAVGANRSDFFPGQNLLFAISKDNDLQWIADWARFHAVHQGVSAVLLFDNNSSRYEPGEIEQALAGVPGLKRVGVVPVPFTYPMRDLSRPGGMFWAHFLQPSVFTNMFRRYGAKAHGILNCDIDELAVPLAAETVFETAEKSRAGTVYYRACWISPVPTKQRDGSYRHRDFTQVAANADYTRGKTDKWALVPSRRWLQKLKIHPYAHLIENRPPLTRHKPGTAFIAHFKAVNTGWKYDRSVVLQTSEPLRTEPVLAAALEKAFNSP